MRTRVRAAGKSLGRTVAGLAAVALLLLALRTACARDVFEALVAERKGDLVDDSLHARTRAWTAVAATRDPRALALLVSAYDRKGEIENGRALLVSIACDAFSRATDLPALTVWRAAHAKEVDPWLWYRTLVRHAEHGDGATVVALARTAIEPWQRAAALQALAAVADPDSLALLPAGADALPPRPADRALVLEALAEVWAAQEGRLGSAPYRAAGLWLVDQLERPETPERTRLGIVRALARVLRPPIPFEDPPFWRVRLGMEGPPHDDRYAPPPGARFLELTGTGKRVAYVIDFSGSMTAPLTDTEKEDLRTKLDPVVTGKPAAGGKRAPPRPAGLDPDALKRIPWKSIRTRADAAVQFLLLSLRMLPKDAHYCVTVFGSDHVFLDSTPGLVPATRKNVEATADELTPPALRGSTNLHGGIARGLRAVSGSMPKKSETGDELLHGATTVFVLSDGAPNVDDWGVMVPPYDVEGTYFDAEQLIDDVERLNLFRRCEIHCIGIGDAFGGIGSVLPSGLPQALGVRDDALGTLLRRIARAGHGRYREVPSPKAAPTPEAPPAGAPPPSTTWLGRLLGRLRDRASDSERITAAKLLMLQGDPEAVPALIEALADPERAVRDAVLAALLELTGRPDGGPYPTRSWEQLREQRNWAWWWEQNGARVRAAKAR